MVVLAYTLDCILALNTSLSVYSGIQSLWNSVLSGDDDTKNMLPNSVTM